jgi:hypothetical protein
MLGLYDMMDQAAAELLGIPVEEYIDRTEWLLDRNFQRGELLMDGMWSEDEAKQKQAARLFLEATNNYTVCS